MPGMVYEIALISTTFSDDAYQTPREETRVVYAEKMPNNATEFHAALASGYELQHTFKIHEYEYAGEKAVLFDGQTYDVYRSYQINDDWRELYLTTRKRA